MGNRHSDRLRYITRFEYQRCRAWWVRLPWAKLSKLFSYKKYGGKAKALRIAILWRDMKLAEVGPPPPIKRPGAGSQRKPVGSLHVNYLTKIRVMRDGRRQEEPVVAASLKVSDDLFVEAVRSVQRWGREEAKLLVIRDV